MRERIHENRDHEYEPVLESYVELEVQNARGDVLVVRRDVVGGKDTRLVRTWNAARLSDPSAVGYQRDFFVNDPGSAQRESGFHTFLAEFIGWALPEVSRFDGSEGLLYMEAIFPMLFVEQKRGWSTIQGPFPGFLRIQDVARRVMEFLLDLEAAKIRRERAEIRRQILAVQQQWQATSAQVDERTKPSVSVRGIPEAPTTEFLHSQDVEIEVYREGAWTPIAEAIASSTERIAQLEKAETPTADNSSQKVEDQLRGARERFDSLSAILETLRGNFTARLQEDRAIESRVSSLELDLRRNQDALKLKKLGSELGSAAGNALCPTCHQQITHELLPTVASVGMGIEENIRFVKAQIELYRSALADSKGNLEDIRLRYSAVEQELREKQQQIRALRQTLVQPASSPSRAHIEEIVRLQSYADQLQSVRNAVDALRDELSRLAASWASLQEQLRKLGSADLTKSDVDKVRDFQETIQRHLERYGFKSYQPAEIELSPENFRPLVRSRDASAGVIEKEIHFEISASDAIRLKWAYYLALLSVTTRRKTNHPGFVIFDEPGQQEIETQSLLALLTWSADKLDDDQQAIIATSESLTNIAEALRGKKVTLINFDSFILQPLTE
jgi:predicted  nucleic acid-binding Zn-ribbon protein